MPLIRTPLRDTDGNRRYRGIDLSPYQRGEISGMQRAGKTPTQIELELDLSRGAIRYTLATIQVRDKGKPMPKSSTPVQYNSRSHY